MMKYTELRTKRLELCPHGMKYLATTYEYSSDVENTKYMAFLPDFSIEETKTFLTECDAQWEKEEPEFLEFAVLRDGIHIGAVGIYWNEIRDTLELGWILHPAYHGRGYISEAAKEVIEFAKTQFGVCHFIAHCDTENAASRRVMEKLGLELVQRSGGRRNKGSVQERWDYLYEAIWDRG